MITRVSRRNLGSVAKFLLTISGLLLTSQLWAEDKPSIQAFANGSTMTVSNAFAYLCVLFGSEGETTNVYHDAQITIDRCYQKYGAMNDIPTNDLVDILEQENPNVFKEEQPSWFENLAGHIMIRATYQDVTGIEDPTVAKNSPSDQAANPAVFSFYRDYYSGSNAWILKGALFVPFNVQNNFLGFMGVKDCRAQFLPSVSVDREFNNQSPSNSVDSLTFRAAGVFADEGSSSNLNFGNLRLSGDYATDTSFKSLVAGAECDYLPDLAFLSSVGQGRYCLFNASRWGPAFRWTASFHSEYGYTVRTGGKAQLAGDPNALRLGPVGNLSVYPFWGVTAMNLGKFQITVSYEYLKGIVNKPSDSHDFKVQASYPLFSGNEYKSVSLSVAYEDGLAPIVKDKIDSLTVGLGIKF